MCAAGCDENHYIGEAPDACFVESDCVDTVVEELCPPGTDCRPAYDLGYQEGLDSCFEVCGELITCDSPECDLDGAFKHGWNRGFLSGAATCDEPVVCDDDEDSDTDRKPRKPHRNTRGKGHIKHTFDVNLDSDDPLEGVPLAGSRCTTTCRRTPNGSTVCDTVCRDTFA